MSQPRLISSVISEQALAALQGGRVAGDTRRHCATNCLARAAPTSALQLRSAIAGGDINIFRSFLRDVVVAEKSTRVDDPPGTGVVRAEFVASQILGIAMARYIFELEPIASMPVPQVVDVIAPNLQRYLTGELPLAD